MDRTSPQVKGIGSPVTELPAQVTPRDRRTVILAARYPARPRVLPAIGQAGRHVTLR